MEEDGDQPKAVLVPPGSAGATESTAPPALPSSQSPAKQSLKERLAATVKAPEEVVNQAAAHAPASPAAAATVHPGTAPALGAQAIITPASSAGASSQHAVVVDQGAQVGVADGAIVSHVVSDAPAPAQTSPPLSQQAPAAKAPPAPLPLAQPAAAEPPALPKDPASPMIAKLKSSQPGTPTSLRHSTTADSSEMRLLSKPTNGEGRTATVSSVSPSPGASAGPSRSPSPSLRREVDEKALNASLPDTQPLDEPQPFTLSAEEKAAKEAHKRELWLKAAPVVAAVPVLMLVGFPLGLSLALVAPLPLLFGTYRDHPATREEWFIIWGIVTAGVLYSAGVNVLLAALVLVPPILFLVFDPRHPGDKPEHDDPFPPDTAQHDSVAWV